MQDEKHNVSVNQSLAELFDQGEPRQSSPVRLPPMVNQETLLGQRCGRDLDKQRVEGSDQEDS